SKLTIQAGDIIVIPAGVGHKNLESEDLGVVGAYPGGMMYDMKYGKPGERPQADQNIAAVPFPDHDPLLGKENGLLLIWK
ncbi:MAG TPA: cupin, partial [Chitinophagaceae bacterium]|nr:cupin [Chitinophagaceae bacterium]